MATQVRDTATRKPAKPGGPGSSERPNLRVFVREVNLELRKVIWPTRKELITYTTVSFIFVVVMSAIGGLQGGFEQARVMTQGGPAESTTTLGYYIYIKAFQEFEFGYASAVAVIMLMISLVIALTYQRFVLRRDIQGALTTQGR